MKRLIVAAQPSWLSSSFAKNLFARRTNRFTFFIYELSFTHSCITHQQDSNNFLFFLLPFPLFSFVTLLFVYMECKTEGPVIGIDLGTTYSCVGLWQQQQNRVEIIANDQGNRTTPSCVFFKGSERLVGEAAKYEAALNPTNTVFGTS